MKWAFSTVGLIAMGLVGIVIIMLFLTLTVNNEHDYYLLKETAEAAMFDSVDLAYYRDTGEVKIIQEKFVENFMRRLADSVNNINITDYSVEFYDIMEKPPKVSILIKTGLGNYTIYGNASDYNIANQLDAILEADDNKLDNDYYNSCKTLVYRNYYMNYYGRNGNLNDSVNSKKVDTDPNSYRIDKVNFVRQILTSSDLSEGRLNNVNILYMANPFSRIPTLSASSSRYGDSQVLINNGRYSCPYSQCYVGFIYDVTWKHKSCDLKKK